MGINGETKVMRLLPYLLICAAIAAMCLLITVATVLSQPHQHYVFCSVGEEQHFYSRLVHHGLNWDMAIIREDDRGLYFIRDGCRCTF